jgi:hypothetical protein
MFANPQHIPDGMDFYDDDEDEHLEGDDGIMEFVGLGTWSKVISQWVPL